MLLRLIAQMKLVLPNSTIHNICHFAVIRWIITGKRLILFLYAGYINLEYMFLAVRIVLLGNGVLHIQFKGIFELLTAYFDR